MRRPMLALASALVLAVPAFAALPPMTPSMLQSQADAIVVGQGTAVYERVVETQAGTDSRYLAEFRIERVEKGKDLEAGWLVYPHFWQPNKRPAGWAGPQGQNEVLITDTPIRLYLKRNDDGTWRLLEPNGWERVNR